MCQRFIALFFSTLLINILTFPQNQSQWRIVNELNFNGNYESTTFLNSEVAIINGYVDSITSRKNYFLKTTDQGLTWSQKEISINIKFITAVDEQTIIGATDADYWRIPSTLCRTTNYGNTWINTQLDSIFISSIKKINSEILVLGFKYLPDNLYKLTILHSTNQGITYQQLNELPFTSKYIPDEDHLYFTNDTVGYLIIPGLPLMKTTNGGNNWDTINGNYSNLFWADNKIFSMSFVNSQTGWLLIDTSANFLLRTTDGGQIWTRPVLESGFDYSPNKITFVNQYLGFITTTSTVSDYGILYKTINGGDSIFTEPFVIRPKKISFYQNVGYGFGENELYQYTSESLTLENEINSSQIIYSLSQNYPNPFNPNSIIKFSIPIEDMVTIELYNVLGEKVKVLYNEYSSAGTKEINFNASELPSGVYIYKMKAGEFISSKKMVLLK
ncbi:MAG TPA: YCF48-related protein [Ignavibacteriaceae bacterium]|nr:YCF48-related protein [Ignavibacteriaceae bacterium]